MASAISLASATGSSGRNLASSNDPCAKDAGPACSPSPVVTGWAGATPTVPDVVDRFVTADGGRDPGREAIDFPAREAPPTVWMPEALSRMVLMPSPMDRVPVRLVSNPCSFRSRRMLWATM